MKKNHLKSMTLTAMFAALIAVMTAFIKIPIGSNGGYIHLGDSLIYLASCLLGPYAVAAASIGGALADLLSGAAAWALPTAVIKALNTLPFLIASHLYVKRRHTHKIVHLSTVLMTVVSGAITVGGYFLAEGVMYSFAGAVPSIPFNALQAVGSAVVFLVAGKIMDKMNIQSIFAVRHSAGEGKDS